MYGISKSTVRGSIWFWSWPPPLFLGPTDTEDMDVSACGSFSYTHCTAPEAGNITPVYTATLAGIFSFLTTDAVTRGAVWEAARVEAPWCGRLQENLRVNDEHCHGWSGIPGTPRSFSHTLILFTKESEKLHVMVCVFSKKGCDSICQKSLYNSLVGYCYFLSGLGELRVWENHWIESWEVRGRKAWNLDEWNTGWVSDGHGSRSWSVPFPFLLLPPAFVASKWPVSPSACNLCTLLWTNSVAIILFPKLC